MSSAATTIAAESSPDCSPNRIGFRAPIELRIAWLFTSVFVFGLYWGFPISLPDAASYRFAQYHYFAPLIMAFALQLPVLWVSARRHQADPFLLIKLLPFLALVILLHFNFKAWMPLVNPSSYDEVFQRLDDLLWPLVATFCLLRQTIEHILPVDPNNAYHALFVGMFFAAFAAFALFGTALQLRRLVLGVCLILLLGGVGYWVCPAVGPFLYREGLNPDSTLAQRHMYALFCRVVETGDLPPGYFVAPLAAMPSLHVAHALFFTLFAFKSHRWLGWIFLPLLFWIIIESVASGWHYLADLPVGAVITLITIGMVRVFLPDTNARATPTVDDRGTTSI